MAHEHRVKGYYSLKESRRGLIQTADPDCKMAEQSDAAVVQCSPAIKASPLSEPNKMASSKEPLLCYTSSFYPPDNHGNAHLQPLTFPERAIDVPSCFINDQSDLPICFMCPMEFTSQPLSLAMTSDPPARLSPREEWLRHLLVQHKIVIHNTHELASLKW